VPGRSLKEVAQIEVRDVAEWIDRLVAEGDVRRITLRQGDRTLLDIPLKRGVAAGVATALLDRAAAVMAMADTVAHCTIEVEREGDGANDATAEEELLHAHIVRDPDASG
jgi:hypothetical protein